MCAASSKIGIIPVIVTDFSQNCRIVFDKDTRACVVVDPGGEAEKIISTLREEKLTPSAIWLTHSHLDHCGGVNGILKRFPVPLYGHRNETEMRGMVTQIAKMYGIDGDMENCPEPTNYIDDGDVLTCGGLKFVALFTPGHAPGHLCFYEASEGILLAGDTVFASSIGRTDLPGGSLNTLRASIMGKIMTLPPSTRILPGHGPDTTVAEEARGNPFILEWS